MEWALDVCTRVCTLCLAVRSSGRKGNTPMWGSMAGGAVIRRWCPPASGTLAWADRYGPVWRTGTRYNAAKGVCKRGNPKWRGASHGEET